MHPTTQALLRALEAADRAPGEFFSGTGVGIASTLAATQALHAAVAAWREAGYPDDPGYEEFAFDDGSAIGLAAVPGGVWPPEGPDHVTLYYRHPDNEDGTEGITVERRYWRAGMPTDAQGQQHLFLEE
jgi:hypothetical protein